MSYLKDYPHHSAKYKCKETSKLQFLNSLVNWKKIGSAAESNIQKSQFSISFMNWEKRGSIYSPRQTFQNPNFESKDRLGKIMS